MNLAVSGSSHVAAAVAAVNSTIDSSALLYHQADQHQLQPISYKIPQVGTVLVAQHHPHLVHAAQPVHHQQLQQVHLTHPHQMTAGITSMAEKKKDIIAQAMREEKIYDERGKKQWRRDSDHFLTFCTLTDDNFATQNVARRLSPATDPPLLPAGIPVAVKSTPPPVNPLTYLSQKPGKA
jgi:hypothetical protein